MRHLKFHTYGLFMIGFPGETEHEARETIALAKKLDCIVASFARVTPYPGTALYERYKDTFPPEIRPWQLNSQYRPTPDEPMWQLPGMTHEQITNLLREAMARYYLRPRMIFRHLYYGIFTPAEMVGGGVRLLRELYFRLVSALSFRTRRHTQ
jgi:anaerobic magnesium-protoporphyrin IX monomethyl ester cyclase